MISAVQLETLLWTLNILGRALVIWRVWSLGLHKQYRWFFAYWSATLLRSLVLYPLPTNGYTYYFIWLGTEPVLWVLLALTVGELYRLVLSRYPALYSVGRWFLYLAVAGSALVSAAILIPGWKSSAWTYQIYLQLTRGLDVALIFFLLFLVLFLWIYPVQPGRNLLTHVLVFSLYFLSSSMTLLYYAMTGKNVYQLASNLIILLGICCTVAWVFLLRRETEEALAPVRLTRMSEHERRLLLQLEALQSTARKISKAVD